MTSNRKPLVVLIEDDIVTAKAYTLTLTRLGCSVVHVQNCESARELAQRMTSPDLAILDMRLPDCHGRDLAQDLKNSRGWTKTPIVAISAFFDPYEQPEPLLFAHKVSKPVTEGSFMKLLLSVLPDFGNFGEVGA